MNFNRISFLNFQKGNCVVLSCLVFILCSGILYFLKLGSGFGQNGHYPQTFCDWFLILFWLPIKCAYKSTLSQFIFNLIIIYCRGQVKLADFGLARLYDAEDRERPYTNKVSCGRFWNANPKQVPGSVADPFRSVIIFFSSDPQHKFARPES